MTSPFAIRREMNDIEEAPGKVWFWELAAAVIDADRCVQCGACVAACPSDSLGVNKQNLPELVKMCTGCSLCWDFCPRGGLRYEATWLPEGSTAQTAPRDGASREVPLAPVSVLVDGAPLSVLPARGVAAPSAVSPAMAPREVASAAPDELASTASERSGVTVDRPTKKKPAMADAAEGEAAKSESAKGEAAPATSGTGTLTGQPGLGLGAVAESYSARAFDRLHGAQDGGVVSVIVGALLAAGEIDGALMAREDPNHSWKGVPFLARTPAELAEAAGSFYNQTMGLANLDLAAFGLPDDARIALVGTPCEVQGIRALQARQWARGHSQVDSVVLTIALLCTKSFDYEALMLRELQDARGLRLKDVGKVDVIHGKLIVDDKRGQTILSEPIKDFHGAALKGCDECADFLGRGADLSVGSVGSADGYSSILVRTEAGGKAFELARSGMELRELDTPVALQKLDALDKRIATSSLKRALDPSAPLFIDFEEHVARYRDSDRAPVWNT